MHVIELKFLFKQKKLSIFNKKLNSKGELKDTNLHMIEKFRVILKFLALWSNFQKLKMLSSERLKQRISQELMESAPTLNTSTRNQLVDISEAFFNNSISLNQAKNMFIECGCPQSVLTKFAHYKAIGEVPLPAPSQISDSFAQNNQPLVLPQIMSESPPKNPIDKIKKQNTNNSEYAPGSSRKRAVVWSDEEDARLITAVSRFGCNDWKMVAAFVGFGRTSSQCNQRWTRALNPTISHKPWTNEEDNLLIQLVQENGEGGWRKIANKISGRTDLQCRHRYLTLKKTREPPVSDVKNVLNMSLLYTLNPNNKTITELPKLMSIEKMPFQRLPPLMFPRSGTNSV